MCVCIYIYIYEALIPLSARLANMFKHVDYMLYGWLMFKLLYNVVYAMSTNVQTTGWYCQFQHVVESAEVCRAFWDGRARLWGHTCKQLPDMWLKLHVYMCIYVCMCIYIYIYTCALHIYIYVILCYVIMIYYSILYYTIWYYTIYYYTILH